MDINIKNNTIYPELLDWVKNDKHFSFARYNDGEWGLILKKEPQFGVIERNWGYSFSGWSKVLRTIVEKPLKYFVGVNPNIYRDWGDDIKRVSNPNINMVNSEIFYSISFAKFNELLNLFKTKTILLVGPNYLGSLSFHTSHIITPEKLVWDHTEKLKSEIKNFLSKHDNVIIIYCAAMATNILIDDLYDEFGLTITQIDMGSSLDPHAGVVSRTGHEKYMIEHGLEITTYLKGPRKKVVKKVNEPEKIDGLRKMINDSDYFSSEDNCSDIKNEVEYFLKSNEYLKEFIVKLSEKIEWEYMSYPVVVNKIKNIDNFTLARYQDGDWTCMLKIEPHFSKKELKYGYEIGPLGETLLDILKQKPEYYITVNAGTLHERVGLAWPYLKDLKNLIVGEIFRSVSVTKGLDNFINVIKNRTVILVGPDYLKNLEGFKREHIKVPFGNTVGGTYLEKKVMNKIETNLGVLIEKYKNENPIVLYSCGIPAKIMCDKFYNKYSNTITQIDMGAIWDPYCGIISRPYHKKVMKRLKGGE